MKLIFYLGLVMIANIFCVYIIFYFPYNQIKQISGELEIRNKQQKKMLLKENGINIWWYWLFCRMSKHEHDNI